jgi:Fe-S-cluster containining protein
MISFVAFPFKKAKYSVMKNNNFYADGLRFECQGSGKCCTSHGEYGFVFLTLEDRKRMAQHFKMATQQFTKKFCQKIQGYFHLREEPGKPDCMFLKNKRCSIYGARPTQCRTWPFWPEVLNAKTWKKEVATFCPGVGKGPLHRPETIEKEMHLQARSERALHQEARR